MNQIKTLTEDQVNVILESLLRENKLKEVQRDSFEMTSDGMMYLSVLINEVYYDALNGKADGHFYKEKEGIDGGFEFAKMLIDAVTPIPLMVKLVAYKSEMLELKDI